MSELHVSRQDEMIRLSGHLEDTAKFEPHDAVFETSDRIDFSALHSISWFGVQNFLAYLEKFGKEFTFENIPADTYRLLILFPQVGQVFQVASFAFPVQDGDGWHQQQITMGDAVALATAYGAFPKLDNGQKLTASFRHLCRPFYKDPMLPQVIFGNRWCQEREAQCLFWHDYACFAEVNVESCAHAQHATLLLVIEMLNRIVPQIQQFHRAYSLVMPADDRYDFRKNASIFNEVFTFSEQNFSRIFEKSKLFGGVLERFVSCFHKSTSAEKDFHAALSALVEVGTGLSEIALVVDEVGETIGRQVHALSYVFDWIEGFRSLDDQTLTPEILTQLKRRLHIRSSHCASWEEILQQIDEEFSVLQEEFDRCVLSVQQFDLIKQVFDHRIREAGVIRKVMADGPSDASLAKAREEVLETIAAKLVTDLEKHSYDFFFPIDQPEVAQQLAAGEMTLF